MAYEDIIQSIASKYVSQQSILSLNELIALIKAIIRIESNFNPNAENISSKEHSVGLMQINIRAHKVSREDMLVPTKNIDYGTSYLVSLLNRYGELDKAISAYNAGKATLANLPYVRAVRTAYDLYLIIEKPSEIIAEPSKIIKEKGIALLDLLINAFIVALIIFLVIRFIRRR